MTNKNSRAKEMTNNYTVAPTKAEIKKMIEEKKLKWFNDGGVERLINKTIETMEKRIERLILGSFGLEYDTYQRTYVVVDCDNPINKKVDELVQKSLDNFISDHFMTNGKIEISERAKAKLKKVIMDEYVDSLYRFGNEKISSMLDDRVNEIIDEVVHINLEE